MMGKIVVGNPFSRAEEHLRRLWWKRHAFLAGFRWSEKYHSAASDHTHEAQGRAKCSEEGSVMGAQTTHTKAKREASDSCS